jgi:hypothetical protein
MTKRVHYKYIETIRYTDGTPPKVTESEGWIFREPPLAEQADNERLKQWVLDHSLDGESRIQDFLFRYRKDPKHKRSKYESITYEVTEAWIVECP